MNMQFKVYVNNGREFFEYSDTKKDFELTQSLLDLLYLDVYAYEDIFEQMGKAVREIRSNENIEVNIFMLKNRIDTLADVHIYFQLLRLDWNSRLEEYQQKKENNESVIDLLPYKKLTHIPSNIQNMQQQIKKLFGEVLDVLSGDEPVQIKMVRYYSKNTLSLERFLFQPQTTNFEMVNHETFTEVLYPQDIYDIIDFFLRTFIRKEIPLKICKSCGQYFAVTGYANSEYCNRLFKDTGKTCKEVGALKLYQSKIHENPIIKAYSRAYKAQFARIKYRKITKEQFYAWSEQAREMRDKCLNGEVSLNKFKEWLDDIKVRKKL